MFKCPRLVNMNDSSVSNPWYCNVCTLVLRVRIYNISPNMFYVLFIKFHLSFWYYQGCVLVPIGTFLLGIGLYANLWSNALSSYLPKMLWFLDKWLYLELNVPLVSDRRTSLSPSETLHKFSSRGTKKYNLDLINWSSHGGHVVVIITYNKCKKFSDLKFFHTSV